MSDAFDMVIREYIDFVNQQVGVYMDALAGFSGHHTRVERQTHRISRSVETKTERSGERVIVWASYEDPTQPNIIHNRIIRAKDYIAANAKGGSNEQQHAKAILVFLFTYWEDEIRPRLATSRGVLVQEVRSDVMGDLRILRNVILHAKGIMRADKHKDLQKIKDLFGIDEPIHLPYEVMHKIFILVKQDCARMLYKWLGVENASVQPEEIVDLAIQKFNSARKA
ncbi:MAG: hypothetical protein DWB56_13505 [Candidatus Jettenia sp.]|uniref:Uncharacterized protein n=1 Tax=Candidatus Jettenia caeni TaxID=247490 RepID=I3IKA4_9BACT|nr:hypothetical protein [Candidatus Jettenia sp. AMX1]MBC6929952.1 hypothetical protein [Candidatus Jettenia sp.]NUN23649.1 hypothetical protein [Candidatus Jettenia caeni]KAA0248501.1 MAG: hypothetical protein EDM77_12440 [Candidatus Jettenia sp. AMX1]MCE7881594.1 hypothetical protein [Candidatus Jettenia sp. AMX1]MCQ3928216.1 hypothetical protein [Candidatus Jettenia sp.]